MPPLGAEKYQDWKEVSAAGGRWQSGSRRTSSAVAVVAAVNNVVVVPEAVDCRLTWGGIPD